MVGMPLQRVLQYAPKGYPIYWHGCTISPKSNSRDGSETGIEGRSRNPLSELTHELYNSLQLLQPTGFDNPQPVFVTRGLWVRNNGQSVKTWPI